jgi:uncharacterized NAD(P)/FAD-binding protein YdhS
VQKVPDVFDIAIVGGGAGGVLVALHALRRASRAVDIALVEPMGELGEGAAYSAKTPEYLLNVPVAKMSAFARLPNDFLDYQQARHLSRFVAAEWAWRFVPRHEYAEYLRLRLRQAQENSMARLHVIRDLAVAMTDTADGGIGLRLERGRVMTARSMALCIGNLQKPLPVEPDPDMAERCIDAWNYAKVDSIPHDARVIIVGSGLSMADTLLALHAQGHDAAIDVVSRHALLPLPHAQDQAPADFDTDELMRLDLRGRMRRLRELAALAQAQGRSWQSVMERIRPLGQELWCSMSSQDQRRFLRHVRRYWDVHRHRIDPALEASIRAMLDSGQVRLHRAGMRAATVDGTQLRVEVSAGDGCRRTLWVDNIVNATGVELGAHAMKHALLRHCLQNGYARPGPHGLGIHTMPDGSLVAADGNVRNHCRVLGSLRIGDLWESLAIPELRAQAEQIARDLLEKSR